MNVSATIIERIGSSAKRLGLSQAELARRLCVERQTVSKWLTIKSSLPSESNILKLASILGTSISYLYGETDDPRPAPDWFSGAGPQTELEARVEKAKAELAKVMQILDGGVSATPAPVTQLRPVNARRQASQEEAPLKVARSAKTLKNKRRGD